MFAWASFHSLRVLVADLSVRSSRARGVPAPDEPTAASRGRRRLESEGDRRGRWLPDHLERFLPKAKVIPAVNQIEVHPYFQQREVQWMNAQHGILTQAWSPIGGITFYRGGGKSTLEDRAILKIAGGHGKSAAQIMLRWHLQQGRQVMPKSTKPGRIAEMHTGEIPGAELRWVRYRGPGARLPDAVLALSAVDAPPKS